MFEVENTFEVEKAISLTQKIISLCSTDNEINYTKLIKLAYFCDREMLRRTGKFITGDTMYSMPLGPVPSKLYSLISNNIPTKHFKQIKSWDSDQYKWNQYLETAGYNVVIAKEFNTDLDEKEEEVIVDIIGNFGRWNWKKLVIFCHEYLPEWKDPQGSSVPIDKKVILDSPG